MQRLIAVLALLLSFVGCQAAESRLEMLSSAERATIIPYKPDGFSKSLPNPQVFRWACSRTSSR